MNKGCILALTLCACMTGCSSIEPPDPSTGKYSTQYPQSVLEYSIYMNKQITVFTNQISTRLNQAAHSKDGIYENEADLATESVEIMQDAYDEVIATQPPKNYEDDRLATLEAMQTAIDHMQEYADAAANGETDFSDYTHSFESDFNALTGMASLYYE